MGGLARVAARRTARRPARYGARPGLAATPPPAAAQWEQVDVRGLRVERTRDFGESYLALALWRTLEQWMHTKGPGTCARQLVRQLAGIKSVDVVLPVRRAGVRTELRLRLVATP